MRGVSPDSVDTNDYRLWELVSSLHVDKLWNRTLTHVLWKGFDVAFACQRRVPLVDFMQSANSFNIN